MLPYLFFDFFHHFMKLSSNQTYENYISCKCNLRTCTAVVSNFSAWLTFTKTFLRIISKHNVKFVLVVPPTDLIAFNSTKRISENVNIKNVRKSDTCSILCHLEIYYSVFIFQFTIATHSRHSKNKVRKWTIIFSFTIMENLQPNLHTCEGRKI